MKIYPYLLILLSLISFVSAELQITEIMYNPSTEMGSDSDLEWVEVYNNGESVFNLSGFTINNKKVDSAIISPKEYLVIAKEVIDGSDSDSDSFESFYGNNDRVWNSSDGNYNVIDAQSFSLSNTAGKVILTDGAITINVSYLDDFGGDGTGHTIEFVSGVCLESKESYGTPGRENTADPNYVPPEKRDLKLSVYLDNQIYTHYLYDDLFKIKYLEKDNCSEKEAVRVHYYLFDENNNTLKDNNFLRENIGCSTYSNTGSLFLEKGGKLTLCGKIVDLDFEDINLDNNFVCQEIEVVDTSKIPCDLNLNILTEKVFYANKEKVGFYNQLNEKTYPFSINYWVEDLFGNYIKDKIITSNTNKKSYTPNIEEEDRVLFIKAEVKPLCNDTNSTNNFAEKMLIIANTQLSSESGDDNSEDDSKIEIKKTSPKEISFGDLVKAEIEVYKGNTGKYSLSAYLEKDGKKISESTKINLKDKYTNYKVTLPVQIKPNCNLKIKEGDANLIVEGLGEKDEIEISIEGVDKTLCRDYLSYVKELEKEKSKSEGSGASNKLSYQIVILPNNVFSGEELDLKLRFNGDSSQHEFKVWAYLYRGSKCYSCCNDCERVLERDDNLLEFNLDENENKDIGLPLTIDGNMKEGEYKIKVKINKDNQKTDKELTETIIVKEKEETKLSQKTNQITGMATSNLAEDYDFGLSAKELKIKEKSKGIVIYESSSEKAKNVIPYLLIIILGLVCFVLIKKH
jgi:hypothetical protein